MVKKWVARHLKSMVLQLLFLDFDDLGWNFSHLKKNV